MFNLGEVGQKFKMLRSMETILLRLENIKIDQEPTIMVHMEVKLQEGQEAITTLEL